MQADFRLEGTAGEARTGTVTTARGSFATPCFMPVGTRGAVKHLDSSDLEALGVEVMLANTYHLMLRPGSETIARLGGIHGFADWSGHVLTDSGGYQIYSLDPAVDDGGASFSSVYDGSPCRLTPEDAVTEQALIGADITMVLDVCPPATSARPDLEEAVRRTALWARRGRDAFAAHPDAAQRQCQFGIVQGGAEADLRRESAERTVEIGFDGYAVGGLSVGEERPAMLAALEACTAVLPADSPRYFMGLGDPVGIVEAVARGIDMFDCVLPARLGRHGTVLSDAGRYNLAAARHAGSYEPLDPSFPESPAGRWSRGYLRHLLATREPTAARLITLHNLAWLLRLMDRVRAAVRAGTLDDLRAGVGSIWDQRPIERGRGPSGPQAAANKSGRRRV
ncbi:MAG: tRNA guanosine(34) transglycosylase Tgt [Acidimicrobiaceae bacterium]|nr:tRNA guanosine(34) transglycosylase Tgt [Acidimicrobiaceae bacterium]MYE74802.1 tRNA guanosine(34) transglycosylase Tgt [Acidimicrobiaceae bacterium]MYJ40875.1 tRNA guanosine(34) transglycosylase Tgt [Acidimicrobiaceae bacterium]